MLWSEDNTADIITEHRCSFMLESFMSGDLIETLLLLPGRSTCSIGFGQLQFWECTEQCITRGKAMSARILDVCDR